MQKNQEKIEDTKSSFGLLDVVDVKLLFSFPILFLDFNVNIFASMRAIGSVFHQMNWKLFRIVFQFFHNQFFCIEIKENWEIKSVNQNISNFMLQFFHPLFIFFNLVNRKIIPLKNFEEFGGFNRNGLCNIRGHQFIPTALFQKFSDFGNSFIHALPESNWRLVNVPDLSKISNVVQKFWARANCFALAGNLASHGLHV